MQINSKALPLAHAKEVEDFIKQFRSIQKSYSDFTIISEPEKFIFEVKDRDETSGYYFRISMPVKDPSKSGNYIYTITLYPSNTNSLKESQITPDRMGAIEYFHKWINIIEEHNKISFTEENQFEKQYEKEFFDDFQIIDEDADSMAFDLPRQLAIDNFLNSVQVILESNREKYDTSALIEETKEIRSEITSSTKKGTIKRISKLFSKIRIKKFGLELLKDIFKDGAKEVLKIAFEAAIRYVSNPS
ncbi:hypothetical protein [Chitinophaga niabensis]|uniref:Uncharacterized protein n=1 Tax=Chitinophaga niabensis TaxID=536979 RepID=A0A1N6ERF8_9BACT|nr:hypothetical protein [Chitinophaga niabensis]SIN85605.1 hypothetical protein SAMN04488055_1780 [Chitinophaga niabensis]